MQTKTKTIHVPQEAYTLKEYVHRLLKGDVPVHEAMPQDLGTWQAAATQLYQAYQQGYAKRQESGAKRYVKAHVRALCKTDTSFDELINNMEEFEEEKDERIDRAIDAMQRLPIELAHDSQRGKKVRAWLDAYIKWSAHWATRGDILFHEFNGLFLLSTLAARRIRIPVGTGKYTPLFGILAAKTGRFTKSTTVNLVKAVLKEMDLEWMLLGTSTHMTPEVFYRKGAGQIPEDYSDMSETMQERVQEDLAFAGQHAWIYDEFGGHLAAMTQANSPMRKFMEIFLEADDCPDEMGNETILRGAERIHKPYLPMVGCTTISNVQSLPKSVLHILFEGGLFARSVILTPPNSRAKKDPIRSEEVTVPDEITKPLLAFHHRLGEPLVEMQQKNDKKGIPTDEWYCRRTFFPERRCTIEQEVFDRFNAYSNALLDIIDKEGAVPVDLHGNYIRFPEKALRVAALLAWVDNGGAITVDHWIAARDIVESWRESLHEFYGQLTNGESSPGREVEEKILRRITAHAKTGGLRAYHLAPRIGIKSEDLLKYLEAMVAVGTLVRYKVPAGKSKTQTATIYTIPSGPKPQDAIMEDEENKEM